MTELVATPGQTIGPFFHDALPFERGNLLVPPGSPGAIRLRGTVYDGAGDPVPDALLEIKQADASGATPEVEGALRGDGAVFTGWGRAATDAAGRYCFTTVLPDAAFISVVVFARGLLNRLFTRAYLRHDDFLTSLPADRRSTLLVEREPSGDLRFDIRLQGESETVFLTYPRHQP